MSEFAIGDWVQRPSRAVAHLVESLVADSVITRCGRRMKITLNDERMEKPVRPLRCARCK